MMLSQEALSSLLRQIQEGRIMVEPSGGHTCSEDGAENDASPSQDLAGASGSDDLDQTQLLQDQWTEEILVEEVRQFRCLWDTSCRAYKDGMKKQQAWREISAKFGASGM